jgi:hypothetical protein
LEDAVSNLPFRHITIFQPSILVGERERRRLAEEIGGQILGALARHVPMLRAYRPIEGRTVARAINAAAQHATGEKITVYRLAALHAIG